MKLEPLYAAEAKRRMGEMLREIPKASGARTDLQPHRTDAKKSDVLAEIGIAYGAAKQYQQMAALAGMSRDKLAANTEHGPLWYVLRRGFSPIGVMFARL